MTLSPTMRVGYQLAHAHCFLMWLDVPVVGKSRTAANRAQPGDILALWRSHAGEWLDEQKPLWRRARLHWDHLRGV